LTGAIRTLTAFLISLALVTAGCNDARPAKPAVAAGRHWVEAWQAVPMGVVPHGCGGAGAPSAFTSNQATNQSLRYAVKPAISGDAVRVRLSNRFSSRLLALTHVTVANHTSSANVAAGSVRDVLFAGSKSITIPAGSEAISDPVPLAATPDRQVAVSIAVARSGPLTWHAIGPDTAYATRPGSGPGGDQVDRCAG
jgi:hypothetical protein